MAEFAIPEEYQRGFIDIRQLDEDRVRKLVLALEDAPPTRNRADLQRRIVEKTGSESDGDLDEIMETLISLYALRDSMGLDLPEFVELVDEMMEESHIEELNFADDEDRENFNTKLTQLLSVYSLDISARAADILYERERTIHGTPRIFTDIRPVFGADPKIGPRGAVLVHTLKIRYHEGREIQEVFLGLDTDQVNELMGVLERAISKAEALKRFLEDKDVPYIDPK